MVSFICNACGNTVKKNQVEKHYKTQCRNCSVLACIDCGVDFPGDTYVSHTSCITEAEKYQGHLYQAKDKENKGDVKQKEWIKNLQNAGDNVKDPRLKNLLQKISEYSNIPRKKKKFENFCKNSVRVYDERTLNALWDAFSSTTTNNQEPKPTNGTDNSAKDEPNGNINNDSSEEDDVKVKKSKKKQKHLVAVETNIASKKDRKRKKENNNECNDEEIDTDNTTKKKKKRKAKEISQTEEVEQTETEEVNEDVKIGKFNWCKAIKLALKAADDQELSVKKLRKKVVSAYQEHGMDNRATTSDQCRAIFDKKLSTYPKVKVKKDVAIFIK